MEIYTGHCSYCNQGIKYQNNWIKHTKTKKHLRNKEKYVNRTQREHKENTKRTQREHKENTRRTKR